MSQDNLRLSFKTDYYRMDAAYNDPDMQSYMFPSLTDTANSPSLVSSYYKNRELSHLELDLNFRAIQDTLHDVYDRIANVSGGTVTVTSYPGKQFFNRG